MVRQEGRGEDRRQLGLMRRGEAESGMRWLLKRWWFWGGAGFMLVAVCAGYLLIPVEKSRITQENYDKIQEGWSARQVEDLLGSCTLDSNDIARSGRTLRMPGPPVFFKIWSDDDGNSIRVGFDNGSVDGKIFVASEGSVFEKLKRRIERRIRALWP